MGNHSTESCVKIKLPSFPLLSQGNKEDHGATLVGSLIALEFDPESDRPLIENLIEKVIESKFDNKGNNEREEGSKVLIMAALAVSSSLASSRLPPHFFCPLFLEPLQL